VAKQIDIDKLAEAKEALDGTAESQEAFNKLVKEYVKQQKEATEETEKATIATVSLAQAEAELAEMFGDTLGAYEANNEALRQAKELLEAAVSSTTELTEAQIEQIEAEYGNTEALKEAIEAMEAKKKAIDDLGPAYKKALKTSKPFFEDTATKLGLLSGRCCFYKNNRLCSKF
jgi:superoxide dismutase